MIIRDPRFMSYQDLERQIKDLKKTMKLNMKTREEAFQKAYCPPLREEGENWSSLTKTWINCRKQERILDGAFRHTRYYYGKRKAENCPAFEHLASWEVRCRLFPKRGAPYDPKTQSFQTLFIDWCSNCPLSLREIKKRIQWKIILNVE